MPGGRPRKPTELKKLQGTITKHKQNKDEPKPSTGKQIDVSRLGVAAMRLHESIYESLVGAGILTDSDHEAYYEMCNLYELKENMREQIKNDFDQEAGKSALIYPYMQIARQYMAILKEFGMTPASRSKIIAAEKEETGNPLAAFVV